MPLNFVTAKKIFNRNKGKGKITVTISDEPDQDKEEPLDQIIDLQRENTHLQQLQSQDQNKNKVSFHLTKQDSLIQQNLAVLLEKIDDSIMEKITASKACFNISTSLLRILHTKQYNQCNL